MDIYSFNELEKIELNQLILDYLVSIPNPSWAGNFIEYKYSIIAEHTQFGIDSETTLANHQNEQFLSWHRYYIDGNVLNINFLIQ